MSGASAFFILIPAMYALFTTALTIIAIVDRKLVAARWAALGFFVALVSILVDGYRDPGANNWVSWFTVATHFLPLLIMVQAFLCRHKMNAPAFAIVLTVLGSVYLMPDTPWYPEADTRRLIVQAVCAAIITSGLPQLWQQRGKSTVDVIAFVIILCAALSYAGRAVVVILNPGGNSSQDLIDFYEGLNMAFHSASALMGFSVGIVLMMSIGYDMVRDRTEEGEIDPLTTLGNRRMYERRLEEHEAGRLDIGGVLVIDLDHFKRINDTFGHDAGDEVLRSVGQKLGSLFNELGVVCRTGGEEFVVLLPQPNCDALSQLAIAARRAIAGLEFEGSLAQVQMTASIGFRLREEDEDVRKAIQRADQAVYCAKTDGRDRVVGAVREQGLQVLKAVS